MVLTCTQIVCRKHSSCGACFSDELAYSNYSKDLTSGSMLIISVNQPSGSVINARPSQALHNARSSPLPGNSQPRNAAATPLPSDVPASVTMLTFWLLISNIVALKLRIVKYSFVFCVCCFGDVFLVVIEKCFTSIQSAINLVIVATTSHLRTHEF